MWKIFKLIILAAAIFFFILSLKFVWGVFNDGEARAAVKEKLKFWGHKANDKVYEEATKYNPEGDLLPDQVDDILKNEIKEKKDQLTN